MNIVQVKEIKDIKTGVSDEGKAWTKTFFIGVMEDGTEKGIATFNHIEPLKVYEMEIKQRTYNNKIYYNADIKSEFTNTTPPINMPTAQSPPPPTAQPSTNAKECALKCSLIFYQKLDTHIKESDIIATAQIFFDWLKV